MTQWIEREEKEVHTYVNERAIIIIIIKMQVAMRCLTFCYTFLFDVNPRDDFPGKKGEIYGYN